MVLYGLALTPLAKRLRTDFPDLSQSWYADDASVIGDVSLFQAYFDALSKLGPPRGYYPQLSKSIILPHPQADQAHIQAATKGLQCDFRLGHTYLGGYLGDPALRNQWMRMKITKWIASVAKLAKAAQKFPHSAYAALTKNKQAEWCYIQRIVPDTAELFMPLLDEIRMSFLPALAPNADDRTLPPWLQHLPVRHGGLGLPNPTLGHDHRTSSRDSTTVLRASLLGQFPLAIEDYLDQARRAKWLTKQERDADHLRGFKERTQHLPADHIRKIVRARHTGKWLTVIPSSFDNTDLSAEEFRDNLAVRFDMTPSHLPPKCDGCSQKFSVEHALSCKRGALILQRHNDVAEEWHRLSAQAFTPGSVSNEPYIYTQTERVETTTNNKVSDDRGDVAVQNFWRKGTTCIFDIRVTDTDAPTYRHQEPLKVLDKQESQKKSKYLEACIERRRHFTPLVFSVDGLQGTETSAAIKRLASRFSDKFHTSYSQSCGYVRSKLAIALAKTTSQCLRGPRVHENHFRTRTPPEDAVGLKSCTLDTAMSP